MDDFPTKTKTREKRRRMAKIKKRSKEARDLHTNRYRQRIIENNVSHPWMDDALEDYYNGTDQLDPKETTESRSTTLGTEDGRETRRISSDKMVESTVEEDGEGGYSDSKTNHRRKE